MVFVQNFPFFQFSCLESTAKENAFYDLLEQKNVFLGYKKGRWKSPKIDIFPKGLVHGFDL